MVIMEITETERLRLVKDKETICGATMSILEIANDPKNILQIEQKKLCNYANSVRFDFTNKKGLKITLPKINLNFGHNTNM